MDVTGGQLLDTVPARDAEAPKSVKRAAYGYRRLAHYRIRVLLHAGKPNCTLLATITPR